MDLLVVTTSIRSVIYSLKNGTNVISITVQLDQELK